MLRCFAFVLLSAFAYGSDLYYSGGVADSLLEEPRVGVSGGVVYLSQTVGYVPEKRGFSPGYRLIGEVDFPRKDFICEVSYTRWSAERCLSFEIPIILSTLQIETVDGLDDCEVRFGRTFRGVTPYLGVEWCRANTVVTINRASSVSNRQDSLGPLMGVRLENRVHRYFSLIADLSISCLGTHYERRINDIRNLEYQFLLPRSKVGIGAEFTFPINEGRGHLRASGGYEMQYSWTEGIDKRVDWDSPVNLQGFSVRLSLDY